MISNDFIEECKNQGYMNRLGYITVGNEIISDSDDLIDFTVEDSCYTNGNIIGDTTAKSLTINIREVNESHELENKEIIPYCGVRYDDDTEEYLKMGDYSTIKQAHDNVSKSSEIVAYDDLNALDEVYTCNINFDNGNITVVDFYNDICNQLGLTPKTLNFINNNIPVVANPFTNGEKRRDVLSDIAEVACAFVDIDWNNKNIDLRWFDDEVTVELDGNNYSELTKNQVYGPVNSLVIRESQIEGENVTKQDDESISTNGETQIVIYDNYFLYTQELRAQAIENIWARIKDFTYVDCSFISYTGTPYLKKGNKIRLTDVDDGDFETYVLKHKFRFDGTFYSEISSPALTKQQTKYKNTTLKDTLKRTEIAVKKQQGEIEAIVEEQSDTNERLAQTIMNVNSIQNLFQITGGSNLIKNSQGLLDDDVWNFPSENKTEILTGNEFEINGVGKDSISLSKLYGNTYQQSYSGKNLLDIKDKYMSNSNAWGNSGIVSVDNEDWITIDYDNTSGSSTKWWETKTNISNNVEINKNYLLIIEIKEVSGTGGISFSINQTGNQTATDITRDFKNLKPGIFAFNIKMKNDFTNKNSFLGTYGSFTAGKGGRITFRLSVLKDTTITTDNFEYEPYVGGQSSPNPDYPQEIQSVTGRQVVSVEGKNLYNYDNLVVNNRVSTEIIDNELIITRLQTGGSHVSIYANNLEIGQNYTIKCNSTIYIYKDNVYGTLYKNTSNASNGFTFEAQQDSYWVSIIINSGDMPNIGDTLNCGKVQLELGESTPYEPYQAPKEYEINLGKQLFNKNDITNGYYLNESGGLTSNNNYCVSNYIKVEEGKNYYLPTRGTSRTKFYYEDKTVYSNTWDVTDGNKTFVVPNGVKYIRFSLAIAGSTAIDIDAFQFEEGTTPTSYSPYFTPIELNKINEYQDYIDGDINDWYVNKYTRTLELAIADMNNSENYPGWQNQTQLKQDYSNKNDSLYNLGIKYFSNICIQPKNSNDFIGINTTGNGLIFLRRGAFGSDFTQTYWKTNYPNLKFTILYNLPQVERTKITNTELINQLNELAKQKLTKQTNYIKLNSNIETEMDLKVELKSSYVKGYDIDLIGKTVAVAKLGITNGIMSTKQENINNLLTGVRYTLTFYITNAEDTTTTVRLRGINTVYEETFAEPCEMKEVTVEFVADTANYTFEVISDTVYDGWAYIYDLMLNSGDKKKWEPALGELSSTIIKMSQLGIRVSCTGSNVAALLAAQGFQVRRFQNGEMYEVITEFTDKGIVTNSIICTETDIDGLITKSIQSEGYKKYITYIRSDS